MKKDMSHHLLRIYLVSVILLYPANKVSFAQSLDLDRKLGQQGAQEVIEQIGIYYNPTAKDYVQALGERLVDQLDNPLFEYQFEIVDMAEPNAFALPGGYIYISRGLLCAANSEDELAGVIAHEIVHSQMRHAIQQMRKSIFPALLQLPGAILGTVVNEDLGNLINIPFSVGSQLLLSKYSRNQEKEADQLGILIVADAGYNPRQLGTLLENLSRELENITGEREKFSYFDTHPYTPNRVKYINNEVSKLKITPKDPIVTSKEDLLKKIEGIHFWENPAAGIFEGDTFMHPDLGLFCVFPEGWSTFNTPLFVGAVDEENERGIIYMGMADTNAAPEYLGAEFVDKLKQKHNVVPYRNERILLNGLNAYIVSIIDTTGTERMGIHNLWFNLNDITFQVFGASYESEYYLLEISTNSLRILTEDEKLSIDAPVLRYIRANEGETLEELIERSENVWNVELTAVMNNIPPDEPLERGQLIKISRMEKYLK